MAGYYACGAFIFTSDLEILRTQTVKGRKVFDTAYLLFLVSFFSNGGLTNGSVWISDSVSFDGEKAAVKTLSTVYKSCIFWGKSHKLHGLQMPLHHFDASDWFTWQFMISNCNNYRKI